MRYEIRPVTPADYRATRELWHLCSGLVLNSHDDSSQGFARFLARNPETSFAAVRNGTILGVVMAGHDGRIGNIYHLAVREDYRRMGIATRLVEHVLTTFEANGVAKAVLIVLDSNAAGQQFWLHSGFCRRQELIYMNHTLIPADPL